MIRFQKLGKRLLLTALTLLCLLAFAVPALASEHADQTLPKTSLVHTQPSSRSLAVGRLTDGTELTVLDETEDYYLIDCYEMKGYIAKKQVAPQADGTYRVACDSTSADTVQMEQFTMADTLQRRSDIIDLSKKQLGTPYVYGGSFPGGFDCSGFTSYVFGKNSLKLQRSADQQMQDGVIIPRDSLQVGDLVFFRAYGPWLASHVGIYVGDNQMIHAASEGIRYSSLDEPYYAKSYVGARRLISVSTDAAQSMASAAELIAPAGRSLGAAHSGSIGIRTAG